MNEYLNLPETTKAYLAGLLDGEGCIAFFNKNKKPTKYPAVQIKMTCKKTIQFFAETLEISWKQLKRTSSVMPHHKDQFKCEISTHKASKLCEAVLPYLVTKKEIAEKVAFYYLTDCSWCKKIFWRFGHGRYCCDSCKKNANNSLRRNKRTNKKDPN